MTSENIFVALLVVLFVSWFALRPRNRHPLPPGPVPNLLGNSHQLPNENLWRTFHAWSKLYGPIVHLRFVRNHTVVINTAKAAMDLLESRSSIYSDRPMNMMLGELMGQNLTVMHMSINNPRHKTYRRLLHSALNPRAALAYRPYQMAHTKMLLSDLFKAPKNFITHIRQNTGSLILKLVYGYQTTGTDDLMVGLIEEAFRMGSSVIVPGKYLVESFPCLKYVPSWFPGAGFKRLAMQYKKALADVNQSPFEWTKQQIASGNYLESFTSQLLLPEDGSLPDEEMQDIIKWCSAALYVAAGDTTVSQLTTFFWVMAMHPDIQKRAQQEVDSVAFDRLPNLDDYDNMPYVVALLKEIFRWAPAGPLGLPHRVTEDDVYEGFLIPKGTRVIANIWAIMRDEEIYPNPEIFDPTRHLGANCQTDPHRFVFGFGRRVCPGAHFAETSLFLNISNVLALFNILKPLDQSGKEYDPPAEWVSGIVMHLKPFPCRILPRSKPDEQLHLLG